MATSNIGLQWLEENSLRAYPILSTSPQYIYAQGNSYDLYQIILDALIIYNTPITNVGITQIRTDTSNLYITITGGNIFTLDNYTSITSPQYLRDASGGTNGNLIVVGTYVTCLPINTTFNLTGVIFEYSIVNIILTNNLGITSLTLGNNSPLTGNITLIEGYQTALIPQSSTQLDIEVGRGYGQVLPCGNFKDISSNCSTIVSSVNGATPTKTGNPIYIDGSNHIVVFDDPDDNRIYIGYDFTSADIPTQQLQTPTSI